MNGVQMGKMQIRVHPAKFDSKQSCPPKINNTRCYIYPPIKPHRQFSNLRDNRSFKEAAMNNPIHHIPKPPLHRSHGVENPATSPNNYPITQTIPPTEPDPKPDCFKFEPTKVRRMSSRILNPDVEKVRDDLQVKTIEGEDLITLTRKRTHEYKDLFDRSVLGVASMSLSSNQILECIAAEGKTCLTIKPLGGMLHLISFQSLEDKEAMINSKWLERWFHDLRNVNNKCAPLWRCTQIRIYGVPLSGWGHENSTILAASLVGFWQLITQTLIMPKFSFSRIVYST